MPITTRSRHIAWATTIVSAAAAFTALSSNIATADIHGIEIQDCSSGTCVDATSYVVGHSYQFVGPGSGVDNLPPTQNFYDNGNCIGSSRNFVNWVPLTAGNHTLSTHVGSNNESVTVTVVAAPAGSPTPQQPAQGGCGGGGSFGSGSANS